MRYTEEQWQQCREEVNRLKRELKSTQHPAHEMHERYNAALVKLKEMQKEYEWDRSIGREFASAADIEKTKNSKQS